MSRIELEKFAFHFAGVAMVVMLLTCATLLFRGQGALAALCFFMAVALGAMCREQHRIITALESGIVIHRRRRRRL